MKILITGAKGFVGKNLVAHLTYNKKEYELLQCDVDTTSEELEAFCKVADCVVHLAGVNRPKDEAEFQTGNADFTGQLLGLLAKHGNKAPIILSSSIQAELDNPYGKSKKAAEELLRDFGKEQGNAVSIYRFTNLFGKWCRPNYNSVVATFCHNIAHGLPITVNNDAHVLTLTYIDDVVEELTRAICGNPTKSPAGDFCMVPVMADISLGQLAETIQSFANMPKDLTVPKMTEALTRKLYATYLSYLPVESFKYDLKMNVDNRGSFTEIVRTPDRGQFSVNISKPGITKGQHWHHTKNEKFLVVSGQGRIQLRRIDGADEEVISFDVSGEKLEVIQMIPGYTHNIINLSETEDLITFMWADEAFDPEKPDTYFQPV